MKKRTVVFVYHGLHVGGAEKELLAYASHLDPNSYTLHIILTYKDGELLPFVPSHVHLHVAPGDSITPNITHLFNLYRILRTINPDIVVGFMQDICFNILLVRMITFLNYKTVVSEQIVLSQWQKLKRTPWIKHRLIKLLYQKADACFAQSESIMEDLKKNSGIDPDRLFLVPSFVSPEEVKKKPPRKTKGVKSIPYFLYMGRLAPEKNIETLLRAFHRVYQTYHSIQLLIAGPHTTTYYDDMCIKLKIQNAVRFVGYTATPGKYYHDALALVIPSLVEGRCRVMIEAMIAGCLVITSDFAGHDHYIKHMHTGLVFHKKSANELADRLTYALCHPRDMYKIAKQANEYITSTYVNTHYQNYKTMFNTTIENVLRGDISIKP